MIVIWANPQTKSEIRVVVVKAYNLGGEQMFLVHKETATSQKYVFGVRACDCAKES